MCSRNHSFSLRILRWPAVADGGPPPYDVSHNAVTSDAADSRYPTVKGSADIVRFGTP